MEINVGDTAWVLVSAALVLLMTPGLALFYGGMVRAKNVLSTFMHSFMALGLVTLAWIVVGYSLAFAPSRGGYIGGFDHIFLHGVGPAPREGMTIPHLVFMAFQMMFAIITAALISGAYAERLKFSAYAAFTVLWSLLVYSPICHWMWAPGGWLLEHGALDFAGGTVVHFSSGISALVVALVVGRRHGYPERQAAPHNLTMTLTGAGLLWFGWFGFNAGSALAANGLAGLAFVNTHIAAALGALAWALIEALRIGRPTALGAASGLVAGLVAITPAAGFVSPGASLLIGAAAGAACYTAVAVAKANLQYDDTLDAFGVHGVCGFLGAVLTGVFASTGANPAGKDGLLRGNAGLVTEQLIGLSAAGVFAALVTWVLLKLIDVTIGLRAPLEDELDGLDLSQHGEYAYSFREGPSGGVASDPLLSGAPVPGE